MRTRIALLVCLLSVVAAEPAGAANDQRRPDLSMDVHTIPSEPRIGEVVEFVWTIADPDPFTTVDGFRVDYGDDRIGSVHGRPWLTPCEYAREAPLGLQRTVRTYHAFRSAGTFAVVADVTATQRVCGVALSSAESARATIAIRVGT